MKGVRQRWSYPESKRVFHSDPGDANATKECKETTKPMERNSICIMNTEKVPNPKADDFPETHADGSPESPPSSSNGLETTWDSAYSGKNPKLESDKTRLSQNLEDSIIEEDNDYPGDHIDQTSEELTDIEKLKPRPAAGDAQQDGSSNTNKADDYQTYEQEIQNATAANVVLDEVFDTSRRSGIKAFFPEMETDSVKVPNTILADYVNISQEEGGSDKNFEKDQDISRQLGIQTNEEIDLVADPDSVDMIKDSDSLDLSEDECDDSPGLDTANCLPTNDNENPISPSSASISPHFNCIEVPIKTEDKTSAEGSIEDSHEAVDVIDREIPKNDALTDDCEHRYVAEEDGEDNKGYEFEHDSGEGCCTKTGNYITLTGWENELTDELKLDEFIPDNDVMAGSEDIKHSSTNDTTLTPRESHGHKREVVIFDLNSLLVDVDKVRLSHLSDISEENDTQLDDMSGTNGTYQVLESVTVAGNATQDVDTNLTDNLPASLTVPESPSSADFSPRDDGLSDTTRAISQYSTTNRKSEAMSGHSASSSPDYLETKAIIEKGPSDDTEQNSITEECTDGQAPNGVTNGDTDNDTQEETNLLPPMADVDSMDLIIEEEEEDGARPDPQGADSTADLLNNPDPSANSGIQKVAQVFIQNRYKTFSKRRIVYSTMIKYILFFFNFICWVAGVAAAGAGYWMIADKRKVVRDAIDFFLDPAIILCITGVIIFIVAFFGFVGALRENILLLKIWHISLSVFLVAELIFGLLVFLFYFFPDIRRDLGLAPEDWGLKEAIKKYKDDKGMRDWIDMVQREMKCCGVTNSDQGYKDWQDNQYYTCSEENPSPDKCNVPPSCCIIFPGDYYNAMCGFNTNDKEVWQVETDIYTQGCVKGFGKWLQSNAVIIGAVFTGVVVPQLIGIILARVYIKLTDLKETRSRWKRWKVKSLARSFTKKDPEPTEV